MKDIQDPPTLGHIARWYRNVMNRPRQSWSVSPGWHSVLASHWSPVSILASDWLLAHSHKSQCLPIFPGFCAQLATPHLNGGELRPWAAHQHKHDQVSKLCYDRSRYLFSKYWRSHSIPSPSHGLRHYCIDAPLLNLTKNQSSFFPDQRFLVASDYFDNFQRFSPPDKTIS